MDAAQKDKTMTTTNLLTIKLFKGTAETGDDGFANAAWYLLQNSGCTVDSDAKHGWDEVSDVVRGEECITLRTDAEGVDLLRSEGYRVEIELGDITVSENNGNSRTMIDDEASAAAFVRRFGEDNIGAILRDGGCSTEADNYHELLARAASVAGRTGEVLTLP